MTSSNIKVAVRCRPLFEGERSANGLELQSRRISLDNKTYDPDYTFSPAAQQEDLFQLCKPILEAVVESGLNGTIMAYGQTGTGKTYTMIGKDGQEEGIVLKTITTMLEYVHQKRSAGVECALTLSMIEIYNEKLTDMLSPDGKEEVQLVAGFPRSATKVVVCKVQDGEEAVARGLAWRRTASTNMNERSSRSHVIFILDYEELNPFTNEGEVRHLFLVDLAGSESIKKSHAVGATASEAGKINRSLLALKNVFLALSNTTEASRPSHVPYRDSRLTEILQDSVGGSARTLLIACISAVGRDIEETKSTLLYAVKAKSIRNATNSEKEKLLIKIRSLEVENQRLKNRLEDRLAERGGYMITKEEHDRYGELEEEVTALRGSVQQLMQTRDAESAKHHISESYMKSLQDKIEEKEAEVEEVKRVYFVAMQKFDNQARELQQTLLGTVGVARDTAEALSAEQYHTLQSWRQGIEQAADRPIPPPGSSSDSSSLLASNSSTPGLSFSSSAFSSSSGSGIPLTESTITASPQPTVTTGTQSIMVLPADFPVEKEKGEEEEEEAAAVQAGVGGGGGGGDGGQHSHRSGKDALFLPHDHVSTASTPAAPAEVGTERGGRRIAEEALHEADAICERVLQNIHRMFSTVFTALLNDKAVFHHRLQQVQADREGSFAAFREDIQKRLLAFEKASRLADENIHQAENVLDQAWEASVRAGCGGIMTRRRRRNNREAKAEEMRTSSSSFSSSPSRRESLKSEEEEEVEEPVSIHLPISAGALCALQHASRNVCYAICESTADVFPTSPSAPRCLTDALEAVQHTCKREITHRAVDQLGLLSCASLGTTNTVTMPSRFSDASSSSSVTTSSSSTARPSTNHLPPPSASSSFGFSEKSLGAGGRFERGSTFRSVSGVASSGSSSSTSYSACLSATRTRGKGKPSQEGPLRSSKVVPSHNRSSSSSSSSHHSNEVGVGGSVGTDCVSTTRSRPSTAISSEKTVFPLLAAPGIPLIVPGVLTSSCSSFSPTTAAGAAVDLPEPSTTATRLPPDSTPTWSAGGLQTNKKGGQAEEEGGGGEGEKEGIEEGEEGRRRGESPSSDAFSPLLASPVRTGVGGSGGGTTGAAVPAVRMSFTTRVDTTFYTSTPPRSPAAAGKDAGIHPTLLRMGWHEEEEDGEHEGERPKRRTRRRTEGSLRLSLPTTSTTTTPTTSSPPCSPLLLPRSMSPMEAPADDSLAGKASPPSPLLAAPIGSLPGSSCSSVPFLFSSPSSGWMEGFPDSQEKVGRNHLDHHSDAGGGGGKRTRQGDFTRSMASPSRSSTITSAAGRLGPQVTEHTATSQAGIETKIGMALPTAIATVKITRSASPLSRAPIPTAAGTSWSIDENRSIHSSRTSPPPPSPSRRLLAIAGEKIISSSSSSSSSLQLPASSSTSSSKVKLPQRHFSSREPLSRSSEMRSAGKTIAGRGGSPGGISSFTSCTSTPRGVAVPAVAASARMATASSTTNNNAGSHHPNSKSTSAKTGGKRALPRSDSIRSTMHGSNSNHSRRGSRSTTQHKSLPSSVHSPVQKVGEGKGQH